MAVKEPRKIFSASDRLRAAREFISVRNGGKELRCPELRVSYRTNAHGRARLGLTVGRKFGNAVQRNRIKRVTRELFRTNIRLRSQPGDLVVQPLKEKRRRGANGKRGKDLSSPQATRSDRQWEARYCDGLRKLLAMVSERMEQS